MKEIILRLNGKELSFWAIWLVIVLLGLSLVVESYAEYEARAGICFAVLTAVVAVLGILLIRRWKAAG
ncbi:MAG: hypothetical protein LBB60_06405 [Desulfovibrio sp.]|jgi:drug/metabolite transporter (DMT)-like permease|nr:hypothetical protein [Desulfovibrio sp.]